MQLAEGEISMRHAHVSTHAGAASGSQSSAPRGEASAPKAALMGCVGGLAAADSGGDAASSGPLAGFAACVVEAQQSGAAGPGSHQGSVGATPAAPAAAL